MGEREGCEVPGTRVCACPIPFYPELNFLLQLRLSLWDTEASLDSLLTQSDDRQRMGNGRLSY